LTRDAVIFGVSGTMFGLLMGWIIGSQQAPRVAPPAAAGQTASAPPAVPTPTARPVDIQRAMKLEQDAKARPTDAAVRAELANLYFDAGEFEKSIVWYDASLKLDPKNIDVSTDLAVAFYYSEQPDRALVQLDHSLSIDPRHAKTLLNQGIIRAFGKRDLAGAQQSWEKVVQVAPNSQEAARARQGLDGLKSAAGGAGGSEDED
jgi:cytochrome c-type biogenesis protein CcmH/NrfG